MNIFRLGLVMAITCVFILNASAYDNPKEYNRNKGHYGYYKRGTHNNWYRERQYSNRREYIKSPTYRGSYYPHSSYYFSPTYRGSEYYVSPKHNPNYSGKGHSAKRLYRAYYKEEAKTKSSKYGKGVYVSLPRKKKDSSKEQISREASKKVYDHWYEFDDKYRDDHGYER
jgi:predicted RNA-binding protein YlxR (DUF448 family)